MWVLSGPDVSPESSVCFSFQLLPSPLTHRPHCTLAHEIWIMAPIKTRISTPVIKRFILTRWYSMTIILRTVAEGWLLVNFTGWKRAHQKLKLVWNMVRTSSDTQISRTFGGFFKDKLQFSRTKIYSFNKSAFFNPLWSPYWLK